MDREHYYRVAFNNDKRIITGREVAVLQGSGVKVKVLRPATKKEYDMSVVYVMSQEQITQAIEKLRPLYEKVSTSDLQSLCEVEAFKICRKHKALKLILEITDLILEGIYAGREPKKE